MSSSGGGEATAVAAALNESTVMLTRMAGSIALHNAMLGIRQFDGRNGSLKDFIQDVRNGQTGLQGNQEAQYVSAVLSRLQGGARDCTYGKTFNTVEELVSHLRTRFSPGKNYSYYGRRIHELRMRQGESIGDFYDQLNILIGNAKTALKEETSGNPNPPDDETLRRMLVPLKITALDVFIRGLPEDIAKQVDSTHPADLDTAYKEAVRIGVRMETWILPDTRLNTNTRQGLDSEYREFSAGSYNYYRNRTYYRNSGCDRSYQHHGEQRNYVNLIDSQDRSEEANQVDDNVGDANFNDINQNINWHYQGRQWQQGSTNRQTYGRQEFHNGPGPRYQDQRLYNELRIYNSNGENYQGNEKPGYNYPSNQMNTGLFREPNPYNTPDTRKFGPQQNQNAYGQRSNQYYQQAVHLNSNGARHE